ncbi:MAG: alpha/beta hydrolase [Acidimicrobiales bacterium]
MRHAPTADGLSLGLHELGQGERPTLLCHANGFHGAVWEPLAAALGSGFARWAVDFRAHGTSEIPAGFPLGWDEFGADVLAAIDALALPPGEILGVGHSMGGAALLIAEQVRPGTFAGLWLYEPITPPPNPMPSTDGTNPMADGAERRRASFASHAAALANFASKPPFNVLRADALHAYVRHGFVLRDDNEVHIACRPEDEARIYRSAGAHHAFARLDEVACPVVVCCGRTEPGPALFAPAAAEALPRGRLDRIETLGHFGPLEAPTLCAAAIREFAASLPARP